MSRYQLTPEALSDLFELWTYIAADSVAAANRVEEAVYGACALAAERPLTGQVREDLTALPLRFWLVQPYRTCWVVYDPKTSPLQVVRVLHSSRNISKILKV